MSEQSFNFEEYRQRREENPSTVRCARCGKWIVATAARCPKCGVHFQGEAQDFIHPSEQLPKTRRAVGWVVAFAVLLVVAIVIAVLGRT